MIVFQCHVGVVLLLFLLGLHSSAEHVVLHQIVSVRHLEAAVVGASELEDVLASVVWRDGVLGFVTALMRTAIEFLISSPAIV